ncbi:Demethylmenaquinone methyltransferase [Trichinella pseudospiralis]
MFISHYQANTFGVHTIRPPPPQTSSCFMVTLPSGLRSLSPVSTCPEHFHQLQHFFQVNFLLAMLHPVTNQPSSLCFSS